MLTHTVPPHPDAYQLILLRTLVRCPESKIKLLLPKYITSHEQDKSRQGCTTLLSSLFKVIVEHVINNIPTMQSLTGISRNTQSKSDTLLLTEFA